MPCRWAAIVLAAFSTLQVGECVQIVGKGFDNDPTYIDSPALLDAVMRQRQREQTSAALLADLERGECPGLRYSSGVPRLIHTMYLPWHKENQTLKADHDNFDRTPHENFVAEATKKSVGRYCVKLWTYSTLSSFVMAHYPGLWEYVEKSYYRPVQLVDIYRILVVYEYGGIFWQYGSRLKGSYRSLEQFLPSPGKHVKTVVEKVLTPDEHDFLEATLPIIGGRLDSVRIMTQVFAAAPLDDFLRSAATLAVTRMVEHPIRRDFDILETTANGCFTYAWFEYLAKGEHKGELEAINATLLRPSHTFSWRVDKGKMLSCRRCDRPIMEKNNYPSCCVNSLDTDWWEKWNQRQQAKKQSRAARLVGEHDEEDAEEYTVVYEDEEGIEHIV